MQLGRGVLRPGERAAAEAGRAQAEVAAVLLHHHVGGDLRGAEHAVQAARRSTCPRAMPSRVRVAGVDLPARLQLDQRQRVRRVAVDLVGRREDERRVGRVQARRLEQVERAAGVDVEVGERLASRPSRATAGRRSGRRARCRCRASRTARARRRGRGCRGRRGGSRASSRSSRSRTGSVVPSAPKKYARRSLSIPIDVEALTARTTAPPRSRSGRPSR